ncbi:MAG: DJ-1/PfpI family protein [Anaerolineae bacterium]|nr:DJ-1/PfpI family protein [Anaerolineae bacterium]
MLAPGFEETEVSTITRLLRRSGHPIALVGLAAGPVRGAYGLSLRPDRVLSEVETASPRAVVLPGGIQASRRLGADPRVHLLVRRVVDQGGYVAALESAYAVLLSAGLLPLGEAQPGNGSRAQPGAGPAPFWTGGVPPQSPARVELDGQVIFGRDSGAAQEVALTLAWLLEQGVAREPGQW